MTHALVSALLFGLVASVTPGCDALAEGGAARAAAGADPVDGTEARRLVEEEGALLLDVRTQGEWRAGHVDGATHIPVQELAARVDEVPADRPVVVYCASGIRSARAVELLREAGREAVDLGSMSDWPD